MSSLLKTALTIGAAIVIVVALIAGSDVIRSNDEVEPTPTPKAGITSQATRVRTVPDVSQQRRRSVAKQIASTLVEIYEVGFVQPAATPPPDRTARPRPTQRIKTFMTQQARRALADDPGAFDQAQDLAIYNGKVKWGGLLVFEGRQPLEAFIDIVFDGVGTPVGRSTPQVKVRQTGTMILKNTKGGWRVDGFDLDFVTRPIPTPKPT